MKYLLILVLAVGFLSCQEVDGPDINDKGIDAGLLAYFPFDSSFNDASGNNNVLQVHGNPEFVKGFKDKPSTAILLNGKDDFLIGCIGKPDTFSISMWLQSFRYYVGEWPVWRSTVFDYSNKQVYGTIDGISGATQIKCGIESEEFAGADIANCVDWFHLYISVSDDVKIYLDDSLAKTSPLQDKITFLNDTIYFGRASDDEEIKLTYFYGKLDEIRIFNRILDQAEIKELSSRE